MKTRTAIIVLVSALAVGALVIVRFGAHLPFGEKETVEVEAKPETKPERPDVALLAQFEGREMDAILQEMVAAAGEAAKSVDLSPPWQDILASLPREAYPYPEGAAPVDSPALEAFVSSFGEAESPRPTEDERRLYTLAGLALGRGPDDLPERHRAAISAELTTENFPVRMVLRQAEMTGPLAIGDFRPGGGLEIIAGGGTSLWTSDAEGMLEAEPEALGLAVPGERLHPADFDRDGDLDLLVQRGNGLPDSLLRNEGDADFTDVTVEAGLLAFGDTEAVAWLDYDLDGWLDLAIGGREQPFEVYRQVSPGRFEPIAWELDLWIPRPVVGIETADFNVDGYPDLYLTIDGLPDQFLIALPSADPLQWRFLEKAEEAGLPRSEAAWIAGAFDFDNDGDPDLVLADPAMIPTKKSREKGDFPLRLFQNDGDGGMTDVTAACGLAGISDRVQGFLKADLDRDGYEDLIVATGGIAVNRAYWNRGGFEFRDISRVSCLSHLDLVSEWHALDFDGDGAMDVWMVGAGGKVRWMESEGCENGWLTLAARNSRPGARVTVVARDRDWILQSVHRTFDGNVPLTIGLGDADEVEEVRFYLPPAIEPTAVLEDLAPNRVYPVDFSELDRGENKETEPAPPS